MAHHNIYFVYRLWTNDSVANYQKQNKSTMTWMYSYQVPILL